MFKVICVNNKTSETYDVADQIKTEYKANKVARQHEAQESFDYSYYVVES